LVATPSDTELTRCTPLHCAPVKTWRRRPRAAIDLAFSFPPGGIPLGSTVHCPIPATRNHSFFPPGLTAQENSKNLAPNHPIQAPKSRYLHHQNDQADPKKVPQISPFSRGKPSYEPRPHQTKSTRTAVLMLVAGTGVVWEKNTIG